jgi:excisionase family DNA binding protein
VASAPLSLHAPEDWPALLSVTQVAELFAVNRQTVQAWIDRGELPATKIGRLWRIAAEDVWPMVPRTIRDTWPPGRWRAR